MQTVNEIVRDTLNRRAWHIADKIAPYFKNPEDKSFRCFIAGGCLGDTINDVDMFPLDEISVPPQLKIESQTKNATTLRTDSWPIQICNYKKPGLTELVNSFDFAHIQCGAEIRLGAYPEVRNVYFTDAFVAARATHSTWFCGSEYPLSSIMRAGKYYKSEAISRPAYIRCIISALAATVKRGFNGYDDFKDQLDAVDLGFLTGDQSETCKSDLTELFTLLDKGVGVEAAKTNESEDMAMSPFPRQ